MPGPFSLSAHPIHSQLIVNQIINDSESLLIILGTANTRAVFIESYSQGRSSIQAVTFTSDSAFQRASWLASLADDRAVRWKPPFADPNQALRCFNDLYSKRTVYALKICKSEESSALGSFFASCAGDEAIAEIDDSLRQKFKTWLKEELVYQYTQYANPKRINSQENNMVDPSRPDRSLISDAYILTDDNCILAVVRHKSKKDEAFFFMESLINNERKFFQSATFKLGQTSEPVRQGSTLTFTVGEQGCHSTLDINSAGGAGERESTAEYVYQSWNISSSERLGLLLRLAVLEHASDNVTIQDILKKDLEGVFLGGSWDKFDHKLLQLSHENKTSNNGLYYKLALAASLGLATFATLFILPGVTIILAAGIASAVVALASLLYAACKSVAYICSKDDRAEQLPAIVNQPSLLLQELREQQSKPEHVVEQDYEPQMLGRRVPGMQLRLG